MAFGPLGQRITFTASFDPDSPQTHSTVFKTTKGLNTVQKVASAKGRADAAQAIAKASGIRSVYTKLKPGTSLKIPVASVPADLSVSVYAQNGMRPVVTDGYAMFQVVTVPGGLGVSQFLGYDPIAMDIPVTFDAYREAKTPKQQQPNKHGQRQTVQGANLPAAPGATIESEIAVIERFAGRGAFKGAAKGPPAVLKVSVTNSQGVLVPLIGAGYQWSAQNPSAPLYRINGIQWDSSPLSDSFGQRIRQDAVITVWQYTPVSVRVQK